ncbi:hypothetical protein RV11_GL001087 [Enterococcus phoeniculicola]|uniref:D-alanyl-D-alanine carboxypeptidase-like core domain-containing protein n=1 Tax=Enterococcus phoeniculicola ATCC BAA-412 TaxID=1158610 RepID=R3TRX5_9ENTE|nr:hypothetical protein UC3_01879 [Enterococcus phoeniculicola ATCC BAA-412]EOT76738.1 hypothetical protein I589_01696 [Enterococcus phoeniculicola ATCC BAA-412]OJG70548.1 hypothetical protein RV11_GL001087 [Enterococcus phoeniculicola]
MSENKQIVASIGLLIVSLVIFFSVTNTFSQGKTIDSSAETVKSSMEKSETKASSTTESMTKKETKTSSKAEKKTVETTSTSSKKAKESTTDKTTPSAPKEKSTTKKERLPESNVDDWNLVLVGPKNKIKTEIQEDQLTSLSNGFEVDKRIAKDYEALAEAAKKAGHPLVMISAFRSVSYQEEVFSEGVSQNMSKLGVSEEEATKEAKKTMTEPGYSEHHTGLALDVVDEEWNTNYVGSVLDARFGNEAGAKWLADNAAKYGFIIRYPKNQEKITAITYEPWHIRYVGPENAEYIHEHEITLEEYLDLLKK